jgi:hypothetical protein
MNINRDKLKQASESVRVTFRTPTSVDFFLSVGVQSAAAVNYGSFKWLGSGWGSVFGKPPFETRC